MTRGPRDDGSFGRALGCALVACCCALVGCGGGDGPSGSDAGREFAGDGRAPTGFADANLIIVSLDTLRADALSLYGGPEGVSPVLAQLAAESIVFEQARTQSPHTAPSHMSLFTSLYPSVHGVQNMSAGGDKPLMVRGVDEQTPMLAEVLAEQGLATRALADGGQIQKLLGFHRGFDMFASRSAGVEVKVAQGVRWIEQLASADERFFLFWHTYEPHAPYIPPAEFIERWAPADYDGPVRAVVEGLAPLSFDERMARVGSEFWGRVKDFGDEEARYLRGLYHGGVSYTDRELGVLLGALRAHGLLDSSILVVLSDHGEEFLEHGKFQHKQLYEECLRVPLLIRLPGAFGAGRRVATPVALIDVMPTVLELLGVDEGQRAALRMQGASHAEALLAGREPEGRPITSEHRWDEPGRARVSDWPVAHHYRGLKFIHDGRGSDRGRAVVEQLFDLAADPAELSDMLAGVGLAGDGGAQDQLAGFRRIHALWRDQVDRRAPGGATVEAELSDEMREQLLQLGYIDGADAEDGR